jgi:phosphotriesterase-related protein
MVKVQSVQGPIDSSQLGITLMHEHLFLDRSSLWQEPVGPKKVFANKPIDMNMLGQLRMNPYSNKENGLLINEEEAIEEVGHFFKHGGNTIVEVSNCGIGRDPEALFRVSRVSGLNIIMGSGFYLHDSHPERVETMSIDEIKEEIERDLLEGVDGTSIRAGIIGEIGISGSMTAREEKVLRGAARAQKQTDSVLTIHLPGWERPAHHVLNIVEEEGGNIHKTILDHMNPSMDDYEYQYSLAERGCFLEFDMIGIDYLFPEGQSPSDEDNANCIIRLIEKGYGNQILLAQDVFLKMMLKRYGGWGYSHILENFVPRLKRKGVSNQEIHQLLVKNPQAVFEAK